jgi:hypothetical protein
MHQKSILLLSILLCIVLCRNFERQLQSVQATSPTLPISIDWRFYDGGKVPVMKSIQNNTHVLWAFVATALYESAIVLAGATT